MRKLILSPSEYYDTDQFVNTIKALRALTDFDLKESKNTIDLYRYGDGPDSELTIDLHTKCGDVYSNLEVLNRAGVKARVEGAELLPLADILKAFVQHGLDADNHNMVLDAAKMLKKYS